MFALNSNTIKKTNMKEMSSPIPPMRKGGMSRRNGARIGSVTRLTARMTGYSHSGGRVNATTHDRIHAAMRNQKKMLTIRYATCATGETERMSAP